MKGGGLTTASGFLLWERSYFVCEDVPSIVAFSPDPIWIRFGFGCSGRRARSIGSCRAGRSG